MVWRQPVMRLGWIYLGWIYLGWMYLGWMYLGWMYLGWMYLGWMLALRPQPSACKRRRLTRYRANWPGGRHPTR